MHAKKTADASTTPSNDFLPRLARRYQAHNPAAGRNDSSGVLFSAAMPHNNPNSNQGMSPSRSSMISASQTIMVSRRADRLVSHTERVHQNITLGSKAQAQAEPTATFSENIRCAMRKMGMHVRAEKRLLSANITNADALDEIPKTRNI